jgi:5-methylcytosine-specific restriction protein A
MYVFPLRIKGGGRPPVKRKNLAGPAEDTVRGRAGNLPLPEPEFQARYAVKTGGRREGASDVFEPDQIVSEYAKRRAEGFCQLCRQAAPFSLSGGEPYLEIHHIVSLKDGGGDVVGNVVALCPNCHRKMHLLNLPADVDLLQKRAAERS